MEHTTWEASETTERTDVKCQMDEFLTTELKVPENPDKPILNLGLGKINLI
jgi:hypothetical protein